MPRRKLLVTTCLEEQKLDSENIVNTSMVVVIDREFGGNRELDFRTLFAGEIDIRNDRKIDLLHFVQHINTSNLSSETLDKRVDVFVEFARHIFSTTKLKLSNEASITEYKKFLQKRVKGGEIIESTAKTKRSVLKQIFSTVYSIDKDVFDRMYKTNKRRTRKLSGAKITDSAEGKAYTKNDFKEVLRFLTSKINFFKKLFVANKKSTVLDHTPFEFKQNNGNIYKRNFISSRAEQPFSYLKNLLIYNLMLMFCGVTGMNLSPMLRLKRTDISIEDGERGIIVIKVTDKRKGKQDSPQKIKVKKRFKAFLEMLLSISSQIDPSIDALLFPYSLDNGDITSIPDSFKSSQAANPYRRSWLIDVNGHKIHIGTQKLRNSYGVQFEDLTTRSVILGNSRHVVDRHYAVGNHWENNKQLQEGMYQYQHSLLEKTNVYQRIIDERYKIPVQIIAEEVQSVILEKDYADNTPVGGICRNNINSKEALKNTRKRKRHWKEGDSESIRCDSFFACLRCTNHIFVNSVSKIYQLISFQKNLMASRYDHEAGGLFGNKEHIENTIADIEWILNEVFEKDIVSEARQKIEFEGISPLWSVED